MFYPCKLINTLLRIADFHCLRIANIQGQERISERPNDATGSWFVGSDEYEESQPGPRRKRRREDEGGHEAAERVERRFSAPEDNPYIISVI